MTAFLRRFNAPYAVPIHDALLSDRGRSLLTQASNLGGADTEIETSRTASPRSSVPGTESRQPDSI